MRLPVSVLHREPALSLEEEPASQAHGVPLYQLFWVFFLASYLGCLAETAFMFLTRGELQNRSGVLYGPFSLVWGLGAVLFTLCFCRRSGRSGWQIFLLGSLLGAAYEYACSWLQEVLFGACFWDYSHLPFNINGRVNLIFSLFWGAAALLWVRWLYPWLADLIRLIPSRFSRGLTRAAAVFLALDILLTAGALSRMDARGHGLPPANRVEVFLDRRFPDSRLLSTFSNLVYIGTDAARQAAGVPPVNDLPPFRAP